VGRLIIPVPGEKTRLITDTYDVTSRELFEAKPDSDRGTIRLAIGQILDYLRFLSDVKGAILLPDKPSDDLIDLIHSVGLSLVVGDGDQWRSFSPSSD
jgi:5-methylcytosine-specific restriction protein A